MELHSQPPVPQSTNSRPLGATTHKSGVFESVGRILIDHEPKMPFSSLLFLLLVVSHRRAPDLDIAGIVSVNITVRRSSCGVRGVVPVSVSHSVISRSRVRGRGCVYAAKPVYTRGGACTHPLCIHTHRSRIRTDPRIHTRVHICTRCVQAHMRIRSVGCVSCVNAPIRVFRIRTRRCAYAGTRGGQQWWKGVGGLDLT